MERRAATSASADAARASQVWSATAAMRASAAPGALSITAASSAARKPSRSSTSRTQVENFSISGLRTLTTALPHSAPRRAAGSTTTRYSWLWRKSAAGAGNNGRQRSRNVAELFDGSTDPDDLPAADCADPARQFERSDLASRLTLALEELPAPQREAFLLAEEGGLSLEEIAAATATGRETVKSRLRYAVGKLRHSLQDLL